MFRGFDLTSGKSIKSQIETYFESLTYEMRSSFAPVDMLIDETMKGYDSHFLQLTNQQKQTKGMIVFNQDS